MLQTITHCEYLFIAPYTQLLTPYNIDIPELDTSSTRKRNAPPSPIVCERLPLHLFELHQVNAIIEKQLNSSTVNSSNDYKRMQAVTIFIKDSLSRTCELVSRKILLILLIFHSYYYRHPLNVVIQQ